MKKETFPSIAHFFFPSANIKKGYPKRPIPQEERRRFEEEEAEEEEDSKKKKKKKMSSSLSERVMMMDLSSEASPTPTLAPPSPQPPPSSQRHPLGPQFFPVLILLLSLLGVVSNVASLFIFIRQRFRKDFHRLLMILALYDLLVSIRGWLVCLFEKRVMP